VYFITSKSGGKKIHTEASLSPASTIVHTFDERKVHQSELTNLQRSGRYWYGEHFGAGTHTALSRRFPFTIPDLDRDGSISLNVAFMAQTPNPIVHLQVNVNNLQIASKSLPVNESYQTASRIVFDTDKFYSQSENLLIDLTLQQNEIGFAAGYLDYIRLFARRRLNASTSQLFFRDTQSVGYGQNSEFHISGGSHSKHVWDITDIHNVKRMETSLSGTTLSFCTNTDNLREFVVFDIANGLLTPTFSRNDVQNQNLHALTDIEMVIVTHPDFLSAANDLANLHRERDDMTVAVVTAEQIYNEFSSGMSDPAAIRNFMKYLYEKPSSRNLKYLLLFGSGTYDNRGIIIRNGNFIITYQSENSWHSINSFTSDDYFGILGSGEPIISGKVDSINQPVITSNIDIGIGRIPVQTVKEARDIVDKTIRYMDASISGHWANNIGLIADDGDMNLHLQQSNSLAYHIEQNYGNYYIEKLYSDAFPRVATADGHRYPVVEQKLNDLLNDGSLLVNFVGHATPSGLSSNRLVTTSSIQSWRNRRYPIFVAATCDFGRFDNEQTGSAEMLFSTSGGAIAVISSTRLALSGLNYDLNVQFMHELLGNVSADDHRLGDIIRRTKNGLRESVNKHSFTLLGNPALKPIIPTATVNTLSINEKQYGNAIDTLRANSTIILKGNILENGIFDNNFNGDVQITVYDKEVNRTTLGSSELSPQFAFKSWSSILYKGTAHVKNGEFEVEIVMPRNMEYRYGDGKITYFARSEEGKTAAGALSNIVVGGYVPKLSEIDKPIIQLFMNDTLFRNGGITDQNPTLIARLHSAIGINTSLSGIGRQITANFDDNPHNIFVLNRYYQTDIDNIHSGTVQYQFTNLPEGTYKLHFTAWDLDNNYARDSITFRVTSSERLQIANLYNYPNPTTESTRIYFEVNFPRSELDVQLHIFDSSGRLLCYKEQQIITEGFTSGFFEWDGKNMNGNLVGSGIYPYRISVRTKDGQTKQLSSKIVTIR
jgi:hypothetical protein